MVRKDNSRHWTDRKTEVLMSICNCQRSASVLLLSFYLSTSSQIHFRQMCEMSLRLWCCSTPLGNRLQNTLEGKLIYSSLQMRFKKSSRISPPPRCHCRYPHLHSGLSFHVPAILRQPGCCENTNSFDDKSQLELCSKMFVDSRMLKFLPENGSLLTLSFLSLANFHQDWWIMNMIRLSYQAHQIILSSSQQKAPVFDMSWRHLRSLLLQART